MLYNISGKLKRIIESSQRRKHAIRFDGTSVVVELFSVVFGLLRECNEPVEHGGRKLDK